MISRYTTTLYMLRENVELDNVAKTVLSNEHMLRPYEDFIRAGLSKNDIVEVNVTVEVSTR